MVDDHQVVNISKVQEKSIPIFQIFSKKHVERFESLFSAIFVAVHTHVIYYRYEYDCSVNATNCCMRELGFIKLSESSNISWGTV